MCAAIDCGSTTGIGSLPFSEASVACDVALAESIDLPFWPQLPKRDFRESMTVQFSEGLPCLRLDVNARRAWIEIGDELPDRLTAFYERFLAQDVVAFAVSPEYASGLYEFLDRAQRAGKKLRWAKGQVTGPITECFGLKDQTGTAVFYNDEIRDSVIRCLSVKGIWQARKIRQVAENVIIFLDEPALAAFGTSAYPNLTADLVRQILNECIGPIADEGALVGIHCCGNTEWEMLLETGIDILSFDAYQYGESLSLYPDALRGFIGRGGTLAWGIVPTNEHIRSETAASLVGKLRKQMQLLGSKGIDQDTVARRSILTPSCGAGAMCESDANAVFQMLAELREVFKSEFCN